MRLPLLRLTAALGVALLVPSRSAAQSAPHTQVVSANPFGIMLEFWNAEYEHQAGETFTVGVGGSMFTHNDDHYYNLDGFWRFYPEADATAFQGWSFGLKAGVTNLGDQTYFGAGFDVDRSWLLGRNHNFYVGVGGGLKRLMGHDAGIKIIPTIRLVNIGMAF